MRARSYQTAVDFLRDMHKVYVVPSISQKQNHKKRVFQTFRSEQQIVES
jgi:hypothetical protein